MRKRILRWLCCPLCGGELNLKAAETQTCTLDDSDRAVLEAVAPLDDRDDIDRDVVTGALTCARCRVYFPIYNSVPRMLTYPLEVAKIHASEHREWIAENLIGFQLPSGSVPPGEKGVLSNFSREWLGYDWNGDSYWATTPEVVHRSMRYSLGLDRHPIRHKLALEVGIGIGGIAHAMCREEGCELVGMDLSYAVDQARRHFGRNPRLHIVQGSIFAPPFRSRVFDIVYSQGVIHHTYSTRKAFNQIAKFPKTDGMLYVWVYSHESERLTLLRRALLAVETVSRPVLSRLPGPIQTACLLPAVPAYMLYQNFYRRRKMGSEFTTTYGWNEALHAARDRLIPPFAHRHGYEEMAEWFKEENYGQLEFLRDEPLPEGISQSFPMNVGIRGFYRAHSAAE
jgi:uncharacterized protein YbaR (Trm112 family)/SAM-dependent methyltransferase